MDDTFNTLREVRIDNTFRETENTRSVTKQKNSVTNKRASYQKPNDDKKNKEFGDEFCEAITVQKIKSDDETVRIFSGYTYLRKHVANLCADCHDIYIYQGLEPYEKVIICKQVILFHLSSERRDIQIGELGNSRIEDNAMFCDLHADLYDLSILLAPFDQREAVFAVAEKEPVKMILFYLDDRDADTINRLKEEMVNRNGKETVGVALIGELKKDIDLLLERYLFRRLRKELERLDYVRSLRASTNALCDGTEEEQLGASEMCMKDEQLTIILNQLELRSSGLFKGPHKSVESMPTIDDDIEELRDEILIMFSRCEIPAQEKPKEMPKQINLTDQILQTLKRISHVVRVGVRYTAVDVYIDEAATHEEKQKTEATVTGIMKENAIGRFKFSYVCKDIKYLAQSGSKIGPEDGELYATLGGFAVNEKVDEETDVIRDVTTEAAAKAPCVPAEPKYVGWKEQTSLEEKESDEKGEPEERLEASGGAVYEPRPISETSRQPRTNQTKPTQRLYALISNHVFKKVGSHIYLHRDGSNVLFSVVPRPMKPNLPYMDIEIARVKEHLVPECVSTFTTEDGRVINSGVIVSDVRATIGMPVYIYGAISRPGLGKIESFCYEDDDNMDPHVIVVARSRRHSDPFAEQGDSGAMVLAESAQGSVYALAMLSGEMLSKKEGRKKYLCVPLIEGLNHLNTKYNGQFTLWQSKDLPQK